MFVEPMPNDDLLNMFCRKCNICYEALGIIKKFVFTLPGTQ